MENKIRKIIKKQLDRQSCIWRTRTFTQSRRVLEWGLRGVKRHQLEIIAVPCLQTPCMQLVSLNPFPHYPSWSWNTTWFTVSDTKKPSCSSWRLTFLLRLLHGPHRVELLRGGRARHEADGGEIRAGTEKRENFRNCPPKNGGRFKTSKRCCPCRRRRRRQQRPSPPLPLWPSGSPRALCIFCRFLPPRDDSAPGVG